MIILTDDAAKDFQAIAEAARQREGAAKGEQIIDKIVKAAQELAHTPQKGGRLRELVDLGNREYREIFSGPYRLVYRLVEQNIQVLLIADNRKDIRALLEQRLLRV